ncbi:MAG: transposase [Rhodocyclales bacterium]|nr:transposase [Rhodocyclales bacterium]
MGTLMSAIHALPGTTFSNPREKEDYNSSGQAALTLEELDTWLAHRILGEYHNAVHSELGCPPLKQYFDGILGTDDAPGISAVPIAIDPERLRIDFLPYEGRTDRGLRASNGTRSNTGPVCSFAGSARKSRA